MVDVVLNRVLLSSVALLPAVAALFVPAATLGAPITAALGGLGGLFALASAFERPRRKNRRAMSGQPGGPDRQPPERGEDPAPSLIPGNVFEIHARLDLPPLPQLRRELSAALLPPLAGPDGPPTRDEALAGALFRVLEARGSKTDEALRDEEVIELALFARLLRASPAEAGRLSQYFHRPEVMLALRDQVMDVGRHRAAFDRQQTALHATHALWQANRPAPNSLLDGFAALSAPDPDLWHHFITAFDPQDTDQLEAALFCVEQASCDQASVALFLLRISDIPGFFALLARSGQELRLNRLRRVCANLGGGVYAADLPLEAPVSQETLSGALDMQFAALTLETGQPRWPAPSAALRSGGIRPLLPRPHWCLQSGALRHAPDPAHFDLPLPGA